MKLQDCIKQIERRLTTLLHPCEIVHGYTMREIVETWVWVEFNFPQTLCLPLILKDLIISTSVLRLEEVLGEGEVSCVLDHSIRMSSILLRFKRTGEVFRLGSLGGIVYPVPEGPTERDLGRVFSLIRGRNQLKTFRQARVAEELKWIV